jgi:uncharacterized protein
MGMRIVLDTNTALSGLLWSGAPSRLIDRALDNTITLISSVALLAELDGVIRRPKFASQLATRGLEAETFITGYAALVTLVLPAKIEPVILRDPDDDLVLATALSGEARLIISGDKDLLDLGTWQGINIATATNALALIEGS